MERLTRPNINVDPDTDRFLHAAIGGKEIDWKQSRDNTLNVLINGPTSNGFGKDIFRKMARDLYGRLKAYEDTGMYPESVEALKLSMMGKAISEVTEFDGLPIDRLRELAEADRISTHAPAGGATGELANAYKYLRDKPLELFRNDYRSHSGGAPCRPQVRYQVHGQHRRRKYGGEQRHGDDGLLFPPLGVRGFREHFESELERGEQASTVRLLFRREQQN